MSHPTRRRAMFLGAALGSAATLAAVIGLGVAASAGTAASTAKPRNISPPTISGTPQEGRTLRGSRGEWANNPTDYDFFWLRCDKNGGSCATIDGAAGATYTLTSADVGNTIRFRVRADNADGSTTATSVPTAVIAPAAKPPPATGCPAGPGPAQVAAVSPPARLVVDNLQFVPAVVTRGTRQIVARFHVSNTCGQAVQGALVYATAVPFNQLSIPNEQPTDQGGWAEMTFVTRSGFPVSPRQQLIAMFVRARKPGENVLTGISTRRLVSVDVDLRST